MKYMHGEHITILWKLFLLDIQEDGLIRITVIAELILLHIHIVSLLVNIVESFNRL
jgi:hypothetical protein